MSTKCEHFLGLWMRPGFLKSLGFFFWVSLALCSLCFCCLAFLFLLGAKSATFRGFGFKGTKPKSRSPALGGILDTKKVPSVRVAWASLVVQKPYQTESLSFGEPRMVWDFLFFGFGTLFSSVEESIGASICMGSKSLD